MADLNALLQASTYEDLVTSSLALLSSAGWPLTAWQPTSVPRTLLSICMRAVSDASLSIQQIARGGYLDLAEDDWLDLLAWSTFGVRRHAAQTARQDITIRDAASIGGVTFQPGTISVTDGLSTFTNIAEIIVTTGGSTVGTFEAVVAGSIPNASITAGTLTVIQSATGHAGYTATPVPAPSGGYRPGIDKESDPDLRRRCRNRWSTLGAGATAAAFQYLATTCSPAISRAIAVPMGDGAITVYCSGPPNSATISYTDLNAVAALLASRTPITNNITVYAADVTPLSLGCICRVKTAFYDTAPATIQTAILTYLRTVPIGGVVQINRIIGCFNVPGVVSVIVTNGSSTTPVTQTADLTLAENQAPCVDLSRFTFQVTS